MRHGPKPHPGKSGLDGGSDREVLMPHAVFAVTMDYLGPGRLFRTRPKEKGS